MEQKRKRTYIIRWSDAIKFPSGSITNMAVRSGDWKDIEEYARQIAEEHNVTVEVID